MFRIMGKLKEDVPHKLKNGTYPVEGIFADCGGFHFQTAQSDEYIVLSCITPEICSEWSR